MAILHWDGGEGYQYTSDTTALTDKWNKVGAIVSQQAFSVAVVRSGALGTRSIHFNTGEGYISVADIGTVYVEFWRAFLILGGGTDILYLRDSSNNIHLRMARIDGGTNHIIRFYDANNAQVGSDIAVATGVWKHFGIKLVVGNSGTLTVRVDDTVQINALSGDFQNGANAFVSRITFTQVYSGFNFDDLVIQDSGGAFLGSGIHCVGAWPTSAGDSTQWTPLSGNNWDNVEEKQPDEDTTYNSDGTSGHLDLFNVTNLPSYTGNVLGVDVWARMRKDNGGTEEAKIATKTEATVYYGSNESLTNSYAPYRKQYLVNPNTTVAWTQTEVNDMQIGAEVV